MPPTAEEKAAAKAAADKAKADQAAAQKAQLDAVGTREVVFIRTNPEYAYQCGERGTLSDVKADALVKGGFARYADAETAEVPNTDEAR